MRTPVKPVSKKRYRSEIGSRWSVLFTPEEREALERMADERGVTAAVVIRDFIREKGMRKTAAA